MHRKDACHCWICAGPDDPVGLAARDLNMVWHIEEHGWSVVVVAEEAEVPGWAYSVGLWHTARAAEVCLFGLRGRDMHAWINAVGQQVVAGQPVLPGQRRFGVLDGFPLEVRPVRPSWHAGLFDLLDDFYRGPVPVRQLVWPDRQGRFPWQSGAGDRCRANQPWLWLPQDDHPPGRWTRLAELADSPFPGAAGDELVVGSARVISGEAPIAGVVHTSDGRWEFRDGRPNAATGLVHLRHLIAAHPHIRDFVDLPRGHAAWRQPDGNWCRAPHNG